MRRLDREHPLSRALSGLLGPAAGEKDLFVEALPSSRQVCRFSSASGEALGVGKFFSAYPPSTSADRSLVTEYHNYLQAPALGLDQGPAALPRLLGRSPAAGLGLLLQAIPGPDLDSLVAAAAYRGQTGPLHRALDNLAELLAYFHTRAVDRQPVAATPALKYFDKLKGQLRLLGLLSEADEANFEEERRAWEARLASFSDRAVLVHGDATPTNFLFPDGRAVALDLERLGTADRLWDLSWVAGELKHGWGLRTQAPDGAEPAIRAFFAAYLAALPADGALTRRIFSLNPFYMALAELRIARNAYLPWDWRRSLVAEARRCLAAGRRL